MTWYILSFGQTDAIHGVTFNGNNVLISGTNRDSYVTMSGMSFTAIMDANNNGKKYGNMEKYGKPCPNTAIHIFASIYSKCCDVDVKMLTNFSKPMIKMAMLEKTGEYFISRDERL